MLPTDENEVSSAEEDVNEKKGKRKQSAKTKKSPPTFEELAKDHGLKDTSLAIPIENYYCSKAALATITEDDMAELKLMLGQHGLLKKLVVTLTRTKPSRRSTLVLIQQVFQRWHHCLQNKNDNREILDRKPLMPFPPLETCIRWNNSQNGSLCKAGKQCKYEHACLA